MREILFRGKRTDNGEWVQGYPCRYGWTGKEKDYIIPDYASALYTVEIDPSTVGQYTGLTDMNDKKIFEGDIIQVKFEFPPCDPGIWYENYEVYFDDESHEWRVKRGSYTYSLWEYDQDCVVVGNVYDSPKLLSSHINYKAYQSVPLPESPKEANA